MEQFHGIEMSQVGYLAPELTLVIAAVILALLDLFMPRSASRNSLGWLTLVSIVISAVFVIFRLNPSEPISILGQSYRIDDFGNLLKLLFLTATGLIVLMSIGSLKDVEHKGEFYYLLLPAVLGAMVMSSSTDLITLYVGLELLSITTYVLVAIRKGNQQSNEGAFKYIVLGGISSATILYGMSFLYGMSGSTNLGAIQQALINNASHFPALIFMSFFLLLAGFGFKIAAAPFHTWAPDVYQGAPTPITAFLAVVSKGAAFAVLFRIVYDTYYGVTVSLDMPIDADIFRTLGVLAAVAMIIGNAQALRQKNMKRLFAYSGVANAGYLLVPIALQFSLVHYENFPEFFYYLTAYLFMNIGALALVIMIERTTGHNEMSGFAGLYYRSPLTAIAMVLIVLSLAGFPVTGGFFGKVFIILGAMETHSYWLGAIMIGTSVISFFYYFNIIKQMFMRPDDESKELSTTVPLQVTTWICALAGVLMGFAPQWILSYVDSIFSITRDLFAS